MLRLRFPTTFFAMLVVLHGVGYTQDAPSRGWVDVNVGFAASGAGGETFTFTRTLYQEPLAIAAAYPKPSHGADVPASVTGRSRSGS